MKSSDLHTTLKEGGYEFFSGVPCSYFTSLLKHLTKDRSVIYVAAPNEGLAASIAAGATLAGKRSSVFLQNSGLGNLVNPLTSLCIPYQIPILFFASGRHYGIEDEPQHEVMGSSMHAMLRSLGVYIEDLSERKDEASNQIARMQLELLEKRKPIFLVVKKGALEQDVEEAYRIPTNTKDEGSYEDDIPNENLMSRTAALRAISSSLSERDAVISTTGTISRELFALEDRPGNFYMQGSMGHAAGIGLGVALNSEKRTVVIDGDGALLMHMGILSTIGYHQPRNLTHIVIDNEAYESTGSQPTTSSSVNFAALAHFCSYKRSVLCSDPDKLEDLLRNLTGEGPNFIHVKVSSSENKEPPRITRKISQPDLAKRFSMFLSTQ